MDNVRRRYLDVLAKTLLNYYYKPTSVQSGRVFTEYDLQHGTEWPDKTLSMIGLKAMHNIQQCLETVIKDGIDGDVVETGVWRGGAAIFMAAILDSYEQTAGRKLFVCDSFRGLPPPDPNCPADAGDTLHTVPYLAVPIEEVHHNFDLFNLRLENVVFVKGWFKDTLHALPTDKIAVLRLDGDMYQSTMDALNALYHKVSVGGFIIVDDYGLEGCRKAVNDFRQQHQIHDPIVEINDCHKVFWRKSEPHATTRNVFVVTNCLNVSPNPLCYTQCRSIFSPEERQKQLFETFDSIRKYGPANSEILYVEGTVLTEEQRQRFNEYLQHNTDANIRYIPAAEDAKIKDACDSPYKGLGDLMLFERALEIMQRGNNAQNITTRIIKLSGRYKLNVTFDAADIKPGFYTFRLFSDHGAYTFVWGMDSTMIAQFMSLSPEIKSELMQGHSLENVVMAKLPWHRLNFIDHWGVSGRVAVSGDTVSV